VNPKIELLLALAKTPAGILAARVKAKEHELEFPHNGCAAFLSSLLDDAGIDTGVILSAGVLAEALVGRGWERVLVGKQEPGDIGVTQDWNKNGVPDHIFLVVARLNADAMLIADNQAPALHERYASGKGKTPVEYFLRSPE